VADDSWATAESETQAAAMPPSNMKVLISGSPVETTDSRNRSERFCPELSTAGWGTQVHPWNDRLHDTAAESTAVKDQGFHPVHKFH
jgi:hypothetical protein